MKANYLIMLLAVGGLWLQGCNKDQESPTPGNKLVQQAFDAKYPGATQVGWERSGSYYVADFREQNSQRQAWFDGQGVWQMTETELPFVGLPQAVQTAFQSGQYAAWQVEDVDLYERPALVDIYVIEVEQGDQDLDLVYTADGTLLKVLTDGGGDPGQFLLVTLPDSAREFIAKRYPGAIIADTDRDEGMYEVDIRHENRFKEVYFDANWKWLHTRWEVSVAELPAAVTATVRQELGSSYLIEEADYVESSAGSWYLLEIQQGANEILLTLTPDGKLMQ